jgi:3-oxoadipate enol-lactonase
MQSIELYFETHGNGEVVVGAGGWGVRPAADLAALLPATFTDRTALTFHYRGMGESASGPDVEQTSTLYAHDVLAILDRADAGQAHLIGMGGMGAIVMMELAIMAPERVASTVLHEPWAVCDTSLRWQIETLRDLHQHVGFEAYQKAAAALCFTPGYIEEHGQHILDNVWVNLRDNKEAHLRFIEVCLEHDARERLDRLTAPTLLITGDDTDVMTGSRLLPELEARIPNSETHVMVGSPHAFFESAELVKEFDDVVSGFIGEHAING